MMGILVHLMLFSGRDGLIRPLELKFMITGFTPGRSR